MAKAKSNGTKSVESQDPERLVLRTIYIPRELDEQLRGIRDDSTFIRTLIEAGLKPILAESTRKEDERQVWLHDKLVRRITRATAKKFPSFGGGRDSDANPIAHATKDTPPQFAAGVPIETVVRFILSRPRDLIRVKKVRSRVASKAKSLQEKQRAR
ncbi:MAG: hypothetical protein HY457_02040 [Parcubacteria group bacterium]|nr:hypothetical protein [Parcubacteria group bacterium]